MHLKSLKVFCDVVGRRSFSRAASENGISQSGASQIVNALEEQLGVQLIDRTKRPFVLTPEGEAYYEGCRKLVQRYFALEEEVRTLHDEVAGRVQRGVDLFDRPAAHEPLRAAVSAGVSQGQRAGGVSASAPGL